MYEYAFILPSDLLTSERSQDPDISWKKPTILKQDMRKTKVNSRTKCEVGRICGGERSETSRLRWHAVRGERV
jgi:hypothetical protein